MNLAERWRQLGPAWRFALIAFLTARTLLILWSFVIFSLFPTVVRNLDLFGSPVLAVFDLATNRGYVYSRRVQGAQLTFQQSGPGRLMDEQTATHWTFDGQATAGVLQGRSLADATYTTEDVFPYDGAKHESTPLLGVWQRFDTNHFLAIAERGYAEGDSTFVYMPLYPLLIRIFANAVGNEMMAALIVSNLGLIGALILLFKQSEAIVGKAAASRTVVALLVFPTAFFLFAGYTESLFVLLALGSLLAARSRRWFIAGLCGALAALTRLQGVLLVVPLAYMAWNQVRSTSEAGGLVRQAARPIAGLLLIPCATGSFLLYAGTSLLGTYEGALHARFVWPWENLRASIAILQSGQAAWIDVLNLFVTCLFAGILVLAWGRLPREYWLFGFLMFLAPLFRMTTTQPLVSMARYALAILPAFTLLGVWQNKPWFQRALVYFSVPLQLYLSAQFMMWGWVG